MPRLKPNRLVIALLLAFALLPVACGGEESEQAGQSPTEGGEDAATEAVPVGAVLSISGIFESLGVPERNGLQLAFEEINEAGGVLGRQVDLTVYDDEGDQAKARQLTHRLLEDDEVVAVFGPAVTPVGEVISPIIEEAGVVEIGFIMQSYLWEGTENIFMSMPSEQILARAMLQDAQSLGAESIAIGYANVPFGVNGNEHLQELASEFALEIAATEKWGESDLDFANQVSRIERASPDAVLLWGSCAPADAQFIKALRDNGVDATIIGNICIPHPQTVEIAGDAAEGARSFSLIDYANPNEVASHFIDAYSESYGSVPPPNAAPGYDAAYVWAAAAEKAGSVEPAEVAAAMIGLEHDGVAGHFEYSEDNHHGLTPEAYALTVVEDGEWVGVDN